MRPWKADPVISLIMHQFIEKTNSPAKFITYFPNLQQISEDLRQRSTEDVKLSKHVHSFAYAPQRYASESQTLCRLVLTIDAVIGMLATVQETRKGCAEAAAAVETLASITTERLLLLSMLGDAALEQYRMVAFLDRSDLDEAEIPERFLFYHEKLDCMFRKQQILHTAGLTSLMLTKLKEPRSIMLANGQSVNWGGPCAVTPQMLEQCLARMSAYCVLSHKTWQAEFPSFELMANFQCFSCSTKTSASTTSIQNGMLQQLAKIIGVHGPTLQAEYHDLRPVAIKYAKQASLTNYEAWKRAIEIRSGSETIILRMLCCLSWRDTVAGAAPLPMLNVALALQSNLEMWVVLKMSTSHGRRIYSYSTKTSYPSSPSRVRRTCASRQHDFGENAANVCVQVASHNVVIVGTEGFLPRGARMRMCIRVFIYTYMHIYIYV